MLWFRAISINVIKRFGRFPVIPIVAVIALGGCAEIELAAYTTKAIVKKTETPAAAGAYKVGDPYRVAGTWYYPAEDPNYDEIGIASWYGEQFHGRRTANGALFDMNALSAAHRTLPMPTTVRVTNLDNGRSIEVTVNDRGPFVKGRIIDLSRRAAQLLGFYRRGTARVRVQVVGGGGGTAASTVAPTVVASAGPARRGLIYVQGGAFLDAANARRLGAEMAAFGNARISRTITGQHPVYRVRFGPFATVEDATTMLDRLRDAGHADARLIVD